MTLTEERETAALDRIDQFIKDCSGRTLIDSSDVVDTLLDIRVLITAPDRTSDSASTAD